MIVFPDLPAVWLVTGCAGFIGSHLVEELLRAGQVVRGLDNFATGHQRNLEAVQAAVGDEAWARFSFQEGDIGSPDTCRTACRDVDFVLHEAAFVSVPLSLEQPSLAHEVNVTGTWNLLQAASKAGVKRVVYASSSAVYGDDESAVKTEGHTGRLLSPYATGKAIGEMYAALASQLYGLTTVGLRYFNVYGPRQDPEGAYAAVIPRWLEIWRAGGTPVIHGDGNATRDFCHVSDVVRANLAAALQPGLTGALVCNVGTGHAVSMEELSLVMREVLAEVSGRSLDSFPRPRLTPERPGDIRHSVAEVSRARDALGFATQVRLEEGLRELV